MQRRGALITIYVLLALGAVLLSYMAHLYPELPGDVALARWVQGLDLPGLGLAMGAVSQLGGGPVAAVATLGCILALFFARAIAQGLCLAGGAASGYLLSLVLKALVDRPRPLPATFGDSSFPSRHVMYAIVFYGLLFYMASTVGSRRLRLPIQIVLALIILAQGPSRVYLGAHWPSDVAGGYLIGGLLLWAIIAAYRRWGPPLRRWLARRGEA